MEVLRIFSALELAFFVTFTKSELAKRDCSFFLKDTTESNYHQDDLHSQIILRKFRKEPGVIQRGLSSISTELHPSVFRSMRYECFIHIRVSWGSIFPSEELPYLLDYNPGNPLLRYATYWIFFSGNKLFKEIDIIHMRQMQHRIFVMMFNLVRLKSKIGLFLATSKLVFYCALCYRSRRFQSIKQASHLYSVDHSWFQKDLSGREQKGNSEVR